MEGGRGLKGCLNSSIKGAFQLLWKQFPAEGTLILKQGPVSGARLSVCVAEQLANKTQLSRFLEKAAVSG